MEHLTGIGANVGLFLTAYAIFENARARRVGNLMAITAQHREIWKEPYERPQLFRVTKRDVDLDKEPISDEERLFVKLLILHLNDVHTAIRARMFVRLEGLEKDVRNFYSAPIPKAVWEELKPYQDKKFIRFVERILS